MLFFAILTKNGELTKQESTRCVGSFHLKLTACSEVDRAYLKLEAAAAILKVARLPRYEKLISPEQLQLLAYMIQDDDPAIRASFARKIYKGSIKLSLRFLAILPLAAVDTDKSITHTVSKYVVEVNNLGAAVCCATY
jgi:hypothetical protein